MSPEQVARRLIEIRDDLDGDPEAEPWRSWSAGSRRDLEEDAR